MARDYVLRLGEHRHIRLNYVPDEPLDESSTSLRGPETDRRDKTDLAHLVNRSFFVVCKHKNPVVAQKRSHDAVVTGLCVAHIACFAINDHRYLPWCGQPTKGV
jgi:hypothetical protein